MTSTTFLCTTLVLIFNFQKMFIGAKTMFLQTKKYTNPQYFNNHFFVDKNKHFKKFANFNLLNTTLNVSINNVNF